MGHVNPTAPFRRLGRTIKTMYFPGVFSLTPQIVLATERTGIARLLYGYVTVPFWVVSLLVGIAVTAGLVYLLRRLAD